MAKSFKKTNPYVKVRYVLSILAFLCLIAYTSHKLYKMYEIQHAFDASAQHLLTYKWIERTGDNTFYCITWAKDPDNIGDFEEDNLEPSDWNVLQLGDTLEIVKMHNDAFSRQSVYVEEGNFDFDFVLLGVEILGLILLIWCPKCVYAVLDGIV